MMFFMFVAISKLFAHSLRMAIEVPSFKLLYQPLDTSIKFDVQAKIDGTVNELLVPAQNSTWEKITK